MNEEHPFDEFPLRTEQDISILMHRDAHFGGNFRFMLEYYQKRGKGVQQDFEFKQIENLAEYESLSKQNLAAILLSGADAEKVAQAKEGYKRLRDLYERDNLPNHYPLLIADLILSEEEEPTETIDKIVQEKAAIVPALLQVVKAEELYDPLFPGYGKAPLLAAKCLGIIGDKRAIVWIFQSIGEGDFFDENILFEALKAIGEPAKEFLLKVVQGRPMNQDNEQAAIALMSFIEDPKVAETCLDLLLDPEVRKQIPLSTYLAHVCEGLQDTEKQRVFASLCSDSATPSMLVTDIKTIAKHWSS